MPTAFYSHPACKAHDMGRGHPECPARLDAIADHLRATGLDDALVFEQAGPATLAQMARAHEQRYLLQLQDVLSHLAEEGGHHAFDPDTSACPATWDAVRHAAGAAVAATDAVIDGRADNAFCAVRPPGHHATRDETMGFCFVNNVAVAARHALDERGLSRVAIVDFDVHHGNGTEDIVAGDERILMVNLFQQALYPFSGERPRAGNIVSIPVPAYTRGPEVRELVQATWLPRLHAFRPQMVFVSAGFDAHRDDDLGQLGLVEADYQWLTQAIKEVADRHAGGRIVSCLEGGYAMGALARSVAAHLKVLSS
ncbi:histone deacetylase family protein [Aquabacterium sp. J223]|uniref:histone deacetylase family protein n=1 Tax=Aquabacterium sp. J223 TaxID=2898431 RepID=UPI0021AD8F29|nr:histone deacetylase family protein [Aquabacterium sp. J223]UUX94922.1 histone deacetylase family protein [Aquabacterium sp. J223]